MEWNNRFLHLSKEGKNFDVRTILFPSLETRHEHSGPRCKINQTVLQTQADKVRKQIQLVVIEVSFSCYPHRQQGELPLHQWVANSPIVNVRPQSDLRKAICKRCGTTFLYR